MFAHNEMNRHETASGCEYLTLVLHNRKSGTGSG